jgi:hypothetical protein
MVKWLDEAVICTAVERRYAVGDACPSCNDENWLVVGGRSGVANQLQAVAVRQAQVDHIDVVRRDGCLVLELMGSTHEINRVALLTQPFAQKAAKADAVFNQ